METLIILSIFVGIPLAVVAFVIFAAVHRAAQRRKLYAAADKYITS